jgi:hypothetical protein
MHQDTKGKILEKEISNAFLEKIPKNPKKFQKIPNPLRLFPE